MTARLPAIVMARDAEVHPRQAGHHLRGPSGGWERAQWELALAAGAGKYREVAGEDGSSWCRRGAG